MAITNGYATLAQVKQALRIEDAIDDTILELAINAASRLIDSTCERQFFQTTATRIYTPQSYEVCVIDDLVTLTTLKTSTNANTNYDQTWTAGKYQLEPLNGIAGGIATPYTQIRAVDDLLFPIDGGEATVEVTGTFGFASIPVEIQQAAVLQASRIYKRNDSPLGVLGFGDLGAVRVSRVDPDIEQLIASYRRIHFA